MPFGVGSYSSLSSMFNRSFHSSESQRTFERLASGSKLNRASDGAAELQISSRLLSQVRGNSSAYRNVQDGSSAVRIASGGLSSINSGLQRARELVVSSGNGALSSQNLGAIKDELGAIFDEIDRVASSTSFNGKKLLDGSSTGNYSIQINGDSSGNFDISMSFSNSSTSAMGMSQPDVSSTASQQNMLNEIDAAMNQLNEGMAEMGTYMEAFEQQAEYLTAASENLAAAGSRMNDTNYGLDAFKMAVTSLKQKGSTALLSQSKKLLPTLLTQLMRG